MYSSIFNRKAELKSANSRLKTITLDHGWKAARASEVIKGEHGFPTDMLSSNVKQNNPWINGVVPGTILTTLLANGLIPDPLYGLNNESIADIGDVGREYYTFWFCNTFKKPKAMLYGDKLWLHFRGINYQAEVHVNSNKKLLSKGMFLRHTIDITDWVMDGENLLSVLVHPPDHPGHIPIEGGQGGDHDIGKDVATQYVEGWDWICAIRDRNTGIWDKVTIFQTGPVRLVDPHLVATFPSSTYTEAQLWATVELMNTTSAQTKVTVTLTATLDGAKSIFAKEIVLVDGNSTLQYSLSPIYVEKPALWWPNGMGDHPLYKVEINIEVDGYNGRSDSWSHMFGFRHIHSYIEPTTNGRKFEVNGEAIFIRGGNWILSDALLRLSEERYNTEIAFHAGMNMNMIRIWAGALAERPEFYNACDRHGMLVWQEFWITGDCDGRGQPPSNENWPLDHELWLTCAYDTVKLLRNHASLALWCGGNEQHPAKDLNDALEERLVIIDPSSGNPSRSLDGTRLYIEGSLWSGIAAGNGLFRDGPYTIQIPEKFFMEWYYPYAFNPEVGNVGVPNADTIRATMPPDAWDPPAALAGEHPNPTWWYHKYIGYADGQNLIPGQIEAFGKYDSLDDFCEKAQLANYHQYRALIEGWNTWMWTHYTGVLIWKTQNPWPGLRGQMYDHLLDQTGGYFGYQHAAEPCHVQLNLHTYNIEVANTTRNSLTNATVEAIAYDVDAKMVYSETFTGLSLEKKKTTIVGEIPLFKTINDQPVYFLRLKLNGVDHGLISRNFYWLHPTPGNYKQLGGVFRDNKIDVVTKATSTRSGDMISIRVVVENTNWLALGKVVVAFGMRFFVTDGSATGVDKRILPVHYSDNWFSLIPNESMTVDISFKVSSPSVRPQLMLRGWNVVERMVHF
ncbi:hypothetical protein KC19_8G127800 [Ceratodon purpureus]|uniref:Glycosyl hydrolase n=1 Tax=Ceratodon purpureus TaxID=3225 RepID=A0A8T0H1P3_CERPU|nr:hypothetical protein KC19_8G127800 [Ceratodon purpureus]